MGGAMSFYLYADTLRCAATEDGRKARRKSRRANQGGRKDFTARNAKKHSAEEPQPESDIATKEHKGHKRRQNHWGKIIGAKSQKQTKETERGEGRELIADGRWKMEDERRRAGDSPPYLWFGPSLDFNGDRWRREAAGFDRVAARVVRRGERRVRTGGCSGGRRREDRRADSL